MERIPSFGQVLQYLKDKEIVVTVERTFFYLQEGRIVVKGTNSRYTLSPEDFVSLYNNETFFLYKPLEGSIDLDKDDEYYSWKSKNAN